MSAELIAWLVSMGLLVTLTLVIERRRVFNEDVRIWHWLGLADESINFTNQEDL